MSGIGEASLVLGLISSIIAIIEAANEIYDAYDDTHGLPKKIRVAADKIPLIHHALSLAETNVRAKGVPEDALRSAKPLLEQCKKDAGDFKEIFDKCTPSKEASRTERLKKAMQMKMKSNRLKEHMEKIMESLTLLVQYQVLQDAATLQDIKHAIEQLSAVEDEDGSVQIAHYGTGAVNANMGTGHQEAYNNSGSGHQYKAEYQYFGSTSGTKST